MMLILQAPPDSHAKPQMEAGGASLFRLLCTLSTSCQICSWASADIISKILFFLGEKDAFGTDCQLWQLKVVVNVLN